MIILKRLKNTYEEVIIMKKQLFVGIDIGGTFTKGVLVNIRFKILKKVKINTGKSKKDIVKNIFSLIETLIKEHNKDIAGIGIALPGPVNKERTKVLNPPNLKSLHNFKIKDVVEKRFKKKVKIENDSNCLALCELFLGQRKKPKNFVCLTLGTGIGSSAVVNGKLYVGEGAATEFGHMIIKKNGELCTCGNRGCFECYVNERALEREAKKIFGKTINGMELHKLAKKDNRKALKVYKRIGNDLGIGLANIGNILDPELIIIGGGISEASKFLLPSAKKVMRENLFVERKNIPIVRSRFVEFGGALGSVLLLLKKGSY